MGNDSLGWKVYSQQTGSILDIIAWGETKGEKMLGGLEGEI